MRRLGFGFVALGWVLGACSARSLDGYESGTGGAASGGAAGASGGAGGALGGSGGDGGVTGGGGAGGSGGSGGASGGSGGSGGATGGSGGATGGGGGSGGTTGGSGGASGGNGGSGGASGGSGGASGGSGGASGGSGGATGGSGGASGGTGGSGGTTQPVCGNNVLESGEQCDDGNKNAGDGCSATCQVVCSDKNANAVPYTITPANRVHCYWRVGSTNNWQDTGIKCQAVGGHLASILSSGENAFVQGLTPAGLTRIWIGGTDGQSESSSTQATYAWSTGQAMSFTNWASGEPSWSSCGAACFEHRVALRKSDGKWEDRDPSESGDGICEWDPKP